MSRIFLSHSSADEREAVALREWLARSGWDDVFLDVDPERGLAAGERWQAALRRAADRCEAVLFVVTPAWANSKWCLAEFLLTKSLNKLIFGVVLKDVPLAELPAEMTSEWQLCHLIGPGACETVRFAHRGQPAEIQFLADGLHRLRAGLEGAGLSATYFPWPPRDDRTRSPYRGLEPLDARDAAVFFGRDAEILQGLDALRGMRAAGDEGLFVILGASGSGKSSFLRAGLLPRLARDDRHFLPLPILRPERQPLSGERGLAAVLAGAHNALPLRPVNVGDVRASLEDGPESVMSLLSTIGTSARARLLSVPDDAAPPTLVLPIDQAEELFTPDARQETHAVLSLIGDVMRAATNDPSGLRSVPLIVVFAIRSDRYEPLQTSPELAGVKRVVFDALRPMPPVQFKEVIVGPASRAQVGGRRVDFAPDLVRQLLADCGHGADTLPLLSLTLARLYANFSADGDLRLDEYQRMGGMADVIRTEAESILALDPDTRHTQLEALHAAFIPWLATINPEGDHPMRRIARFADLPSASRPLILALIEKRLLLSDVRDGEPTVEVAHESLLRQWDAVAEWLRAERDDLKEADRLEQAAAAWTRSHRGADWLIEGARLAAAETLAAKPSYRRRLERVADFLVASRERAALRRAEEERVRQAELDAARERQAAAESLADEQRRAAERAQADAVRLRTRGRQLAGLLLAAAVVATVAVWFAVEANRQSLLAGQRFNQATALRLLGEGQAMIAGTRAGGVVPGLLRLLAAHRLAPHPEIEGEMLAHAIAFHRVDRFVELRSPAHAIAFSADGKRVVSVNLHRVLEVWDSATGQRIGQPHELPERGSGVVAPGEASVALSPDGTKVAFGGNEDRTVRLVDVKTGNPIGAPMKGHTRLVRSVAFSPDGARLVSGGDDSTLRLWNAATGAPIGEPMVGHSGWILSVAFSPDGARIASASGDATLRLWDANTGQPIGVPIKGHGGEVASVAFSPDGARLVSGASDQTVRLWETATGRAVGAPITLPGQAVSRVAFQAGGARIVSFGSDGIVRLWDSETSQPVGFTLTKQDTPTSGAAFSPDGARLVIGSDDMLLWFLNVNPDAGLVDPMTGHEDFVTKLVFSPDGSRIVSASKDGSLGLWDARAGRSIGFLSTGDTWVSSVAFSPDGTRLVSGSTEGVIRIWKASGEAVGGPRHGHPGSVQDLAFSPDGMRLVSGGTEGTLRVWDAATGEPVGAPLIGSPGGVQSVAFSRDGTRFVSGGGQALQVWDANTRRPIGAPIPAKDVSEIAFSPDGTRIVAADDRLRSWDVKTGQQIGAPMEEPGTRILAVAFSPDGARLVSGSLNGTIRLWDAGRGQAIGDAIRGHTQPVFTVTFSPDGTRIATGGADGTVRLWPAPSVVAEQLCGKLARNLSHAEWRDVVSPAIDYREPCPAVPVPPDRPSVSEQ